MDKFNRMFQKSYEKVTCQLYNEIRRLIKLYAANILTSDSITAAGDNLKNLGFDNQLIWALALKHGLLLLS